MVANDKYLCKAIDHSHITAGYHRNLVKDVVNRCSRVLVKEIINRIFCLKNINCHFLLNNNYIIFDKNLLYLLFNQYPETLINILY